MRRMWCQAWDDCRIRKRRCALEGHQRHAVGVSRRRRICLWRGVTWARGAGRAAVAEYECCRIGSLPRINDNRRRRFISPHQIYTAVTDSFVAADVSRARRRAPGGRRPYAYGLPHIRLINEAASLKLLRRGYGNKYQIARWLNY
ncbi:hypothetical protein EVAR_27892_1 [Eumeta japonica]|uniref:Uncharacterized protein n=1 Tax=Eumeta variegata TaxID=151549 RepID=A0A4C1UVL9_EUMVA|nr:hypothetical protein EVAR_27892_1 [Eumeta japonica]